MKTTLLRTLLAAGLLVLGALPATAATAPNEATVLQLTGTAQVVRTPGAAPVALRVGDKIPQGATIITGAASTLHIQPFSGAVSTVNASTEVTLEKLTLDTNAAGRVTKQTALLNLKSGNVVSMIDPAKKDINDYGVSTPKGVAAARGTQFTSNVAGTGAVTVSANADNVVFTTPGGTYTVARGQVSFVPAGASADFRPTPISLASLANATTPEAVAAKAAVAAGVTALTQVLQNPGSLYGVSTKDVADLAGQVIAVSNTADPTGAATKTAAVVTAIGGRASGGTDQKQDAADSVATVMQFATDAVRATNAATTGVSAVDSVSNQTVVAAVSDFAATVASSVSTNAPAGSQLSGNELANASIQGAVKSAPSTAGDIAAAAVVRAGTNGTLVASIVQGATQAAPDQDTSIGAKTSAAAPSQIATIAKSIISVVSPSSTVATTGDSVVNRVLESVGLPGQTVEQVRTIILGANTPNVAPPTIDATDTGNTPPVIDTTPKNTDGPMPAPPVVRENTTITP